MMNIDKIYTKLNKYFRGFLEIPDTSVLETRLMLGHIKVSDLVNTNIKERPKDAKIILDIVEIIEYLYTEKELIDFKITFVSATGKVFNMVKKEGEHIWETNGELTNSIR